MPLGSKILISFLLVFFLDQQAKAEYKIARMDSPDHILIMRVICEAYKRLKIPIEFVEYPGRRSLTESSAGIVDAELSRVFEVGEKFPNLRRIPTPMFWFKSTVFSKRKNFKMTGWESLRDFRIGLMRGMVFSENGVKDYPRVSIASGPESLFKMLDSNRVDLVIFSDLNGQFLLSQRKRKDIYAITPALETNYGYHYVNKKHEHLIPKLDAIFQEMRDSGQLERMRNQFILDMEVRSSSLSYPFDCHCW